MSAKEIVALAMAGKRPERTPVMCQMANGHTIIRTGVHPIDYFTDDDLWADCLIRMRELYDFDGILCHKPGRVHGLMDRVERADYDAETPALYMRDGHRIDCTRNDDAYFKPGPGFRRPSIEALDPEDLLGWAPQTFLDFQASKATLPIRDPDGFEDHVFATLDKVIERAGGAYSIHGEVRSPFDHFLNITGMEEGLMALLDAPEKTIEILDRTTEWSTALAVAQVRRGADAIKISSPFAGSAFLSPEMYRDFILPFEKRLARAVRAEGKPIYTHTCGAIGDRLDLLCQTGISGIECLDPPPLGDVEIQEAVQFLKGRIFIKGNVDPVNSLLRGDAGKVRDDVTRVINASREMDGFILSSACSIAPPAPPENLKLMVEICRALTAS